MADESQLIIKAQKGDQVALARLLQDHYLPVKKYLVSVTMNRTLAEDLTQEAMIRAIQRIGQYSGRSKFSTWLISIATNLYLDHLRRYKRERRLEEEIAAADMTASPARASTADTAVADVMDRLGSLPKEVSMPLILKHYYGYTYEEIAGMMGIPEGTVKSRIFNGVRSLRKEMSDDDASA